MTGRGVFFSRGPGPRTVALGLVVIAYGFARLPAHGLQERRGIADRFRFAVARLPDLDTPRQAVRSVHPDLEAIAGWISAVGAAVALADIDGDGLPNDVCHVEPRTDQVIVSPTPGVEGAERYAPFALGAREMHEGVAPMGCLPIDLDEDGRTDLVIYYWGRPPVVYLQRGSNLGPGAFEAHAVGEGAWFTNTLTSADLDGDGHLDLLVGNYFADDSGILDSTPSPGARRPEMQDSMSRALNAGRNRFLLCRPESPFECRDTTPAFEGARPEDVLHGWTLAAAAADLDGDLLPEVYLANDFGHDRLLHNRSRPGKLRFRVLEGRKTLWTPSSKVLGRDSFKGMGVDFGDVNGDGLLDIYVSNIAAEFALQESHLLFLGTGDWGTGRAPFEDASERLGLSRSGWAWETRLVDLDNDGALEAVQATGFLKGQVNRWPELQELAIGNDTLLRHPAAWPRFRDGADLSGHDSNAFFARNASGVFVDVGGEIELHGIGGQALPGEPQVTRGIATADVDGDGDLDLAMANQWETSWFYRNDTPSDDAFLGLHLRLPVGQPARRGFCREGHPGPGVEGSPAVGATVEVELPAGHQVAPYLPEARRLVGYVDGGNGHSGKRSTDVHFGLGRVAASQALAVSIAWRDRTGQPHRDLLSLRPGWHTVLLGRDGMEGCS